MTASSPNIADNDPGYLNLLFEDAINHLSLGLIILNGKRELVFCNKRYIEIHGIDPDRVRPGTPVTELIQHLHLGFHLLSNPFALAGMYECPDGRIIAYKVRPTLGDGRIMTHEDITEREELGQQLRAQSELANEQEEKLRIRNLQFDAAINNMSQGLCFFDGAQRLIVCNDRYADMYGLPRERLRPGTNLSEIVDMRLETGNLPSMSREDFLAWRANVVVSAKPTENILEMRNGNIFKIRHRPMPDGGWVATHEDVTDQRRSELRIEHMAHHDALTGLANRVLLNARLEQALSRAPRGEMPTLHHLDLDQFKAVNDTLGHPTGDKLLKMVADRLGKLVRPCDTIARMGGDEFAIVQLAIANPAEGTALAQRIVESLSEPYDIDGHQVVIGASIGIAVGPSDGVTPDDLLRSADLALYRAKDEGRGTFRFFQSGMDERMQARRVMEQDLRMALPSGEFELYYQPIVNLANNEINGLEALIRWNHPEKGMILPNAFIPLAEEIGLIVPVGEWVIRQACAAAARWPADITVAVNVSAVQFRSPGLVQTIVGALAASGLHPSRLEIEITETVLLQDRSTTLAVLYQLRSLGVRIAMDDFGVGYSSLTYLKCFPFDKIKIDRSFVKDITENIGSLNIVRAIAAIAHGMGIEATAEGVETLEQRETIISEGCTEMQGFLFSQPLPVCEIERLFLSSRRSKSVSDQFSAPDDLQDRTDRSPRSRLRSS
jgi:diguanylate cyclase (GGDEF)-like protein